MENMMRNKTYVDRSEANRARAEALLQKRVMPAFEQISDEFHRPDQQQVVAVDPTSATSAELTISGRQTDTGQGSAAAVPLRYLLNIAFGSQAVVVRRTVNGKKGSFLGQRDASSLSQRAIVDDVRREWRRAQNPKQAAAQGTSAKKR
jgi:hypothetical protein